MVFESRGSACPPTCADPEGVREDCPFSFLETCECAEGMVLDGTECVPVESCGCKMDNGVYISVSHFLKFSFHSSCGIKTHKSTMPFQPYVYLK